MPLRFRSGLLALALVAGCDVKVTSTVDADLQQKVETLEDCFPHLFANLRALLAVADTWRQQDGPPFQDPPGLTWTEQPDGSVDVVFGPLAVVVSMKIRFFSPAGVQQNLNLPGAGTLDEALDVAATELDGLFPGAGEPFMVGDWSMSGPNLTGGGSLTGRIGGSTNGNELEELRTTAASGTVSGGPPALDSGSITESGADLCALSFTMPGLRTDETPAQQYPIGTVDLTITATQATPVTVSATITFDGSAIARIAVDGVRGSFSFDVETRVLTFVP